MAVFKPRSGDPISLALFKNRSIENTLGNPETAIWSSIRQMCAQGYANYILKITHGIKDKHARSRAARNIKLYIAQAFEFYEAGQNASATTSPLFFYYSYLNLAKALCEIARPGFHETNECYRHGLSWKPDPKYVSYMFTDGIFITTRGVWHALYEAILNRACPARNPQKILIKELLALCPNISIEFERSFGEPSRYLQLHDAKLLYLKANKELWMNFSISKDEMKEQHLSTKKLKELIDNSGYIYRQIKNDDKDLLTFESAKPNKYSGDPNLGLFKAIEPEIQSLNLLSFLESDGINYAFPIQTGLPFALPQIMIKYSILFWLGSLVRYDPHSIADLQDSQFWILLDGFMTQSRIWLLELFEWQIYKRERELSLSR